MAKRTATKRIASEHDPLFCEALMLVNACPSSRHANRIQPPAPAIAHYCHSNRSACSFREHWRNSSASSLYQKLIQMPLNRLQGVHSAQEASKQLGVCR